MHFPNEIPHKTKKLNESKRIAFTRTKKININQNYRFLRSNHDLQDSQKKIQIKNIIPST